MNKQFNKVILDQGMASIQVWLKFPRCTRPSLFVIYPFVRCD